MMRVYPVSFKGLRSSRWMILLSCLTMTVAIEANAQQPSPTNSYPPELVESFVNTCSAEGGQEVPLATMRQICTCGIDEIQNQYTLAEFQKIDADLGAGKPMPTEMTEMIRGCVQKAVNLRK